MGGPVCPPLYGPEFPKLEESPTAWCGLRFSQSCHPQTRQRRVTISGLGWALGTRTYLRPEAAGGRAQATEPGTAWADCGAAPAGGAESCRAEALREVRGHPLSLVWEASGPMLARSPHKPQGLYLEGRLRLLHSAHPAQGACQPHLGRGQLQPFAMLGLPLDAEGNDSPRGEGKAAWGMTALATFLPSPSCWALGHLFQGSPMPPVGRHLPTSWCLQRRTRVSSQEA